MNEPMIDVSVYMTGLIFLKPDPGVTGEGADTMHALLPDARTPVSGAPADVHMPVIQFEWEDLVNDDKRPFREFSDLAGNSQGLWILDKDQVEICGLADGPAGVVVDESPIGRVPLEGDLESRRWIASPRQTEDRIRLKEGVIPLDPDSPNADLLVAAMAMHQGTLRPASFASQQECFVLVRVEDGDARERAMASVVEYTTRVPGTTLKLKAKKFNGQEGQTLELNPRLVEGPDGEMRRRVEIWLLNLEWDCILEQSPGRPVTLASRNSEYLFLTNLLDRTPPALEGQIEIADFVRGETPTSPFPCRNPVMRMLYFPQGGGESIRNIPCSPMWGEWGD